MKKRYYMIITLSFILFACGGKPENGQWGGVETYPVIKIAKGNYSDFKEYPSKIEGKISIEIRPKVDGYISKILVDEGEIVKKGTPLIYLEGVPLTQNAKAAKARLENAKLEVEKLIPLVEKNIVSKIQLDIAKNRLAEAKSNYRALTANAGYTKIVSPVNGVVGKINFREGALVSPSSQKSLTTVSETENMYSYFSISEKELLKLTRELSGNSLDEKINTLPDVKLKLADGSAFPATGKIDAVTGEINPATGSILMRATFKNSGKLLRNGSSALTLMPVYYKNEIAVPASMIFERQGKAFVYVVNKENKLEARKIEVKGNAGRYLIVKAGLNENEIVLAKGTGKLRPETEIKPEVVTAESVVNSYKTVFK
ncbi:MAG: efflux RND transporter periplasmic adaptor subunit [Rhodothermaceae bacterium]